MRWVIPYDPGVTNRSGEIFAQYLSQGIGNIADGINKMTKERDDRAKQDASLTKYAESSGIAEPNELAGMSLEQKQGLVEGRVAKMRMGQQQTQAQMQQLQLQQQQGDQTIMQRLTQPQVPAPGAPTMAGAQNLGMVSPDAAAQGIPAMSAAGFRMLSEGRYNQMSSAYEQPSSALSAVQAMNMGGNVDQAIQQPSVAPQMDAATAMRFGRQAGLPVSDQLMISRGNSEDATGKLRLAAANLDMARASQALIGKPGAATEPDSTYGPDTAEGDAAFQRDMQRQRPLDAKRATEMRNAHLVQAAQFDLDTPENRPWLYGQDEKAFLKNVNGLGSARQVKAAIALRSGMKAALQKPDPNSLEAILNAQNGSGAAGSPPAASESANVPAGMVKVIDPKGRMGLMPMGNLAGATKAGYKKVE